MGSFHINCFATHQAIIDGAPCVVFPIQQACTYEKVEVTAGDEGFSLLGVAHQTCYFDAFWEPMGGFVTGSYADYGQVVPEDTPANRVFMLHVIRSLQLQDIVVQQGESSRHGPGVNVGLFIQEEAPGLDGYLRDLRDLHFVDAGPGPADLFDQLCHVWGKLWDVAAKGRLFSRSVSGDLRPVMFAVMHGHAAAELDRQSKELPVWVGDTRVPLALPGFAQAIAERMRGHLATWDAGAKSEVEKRVDLRSYRAEAMLRQYLERINLKSQWGLLSSIQFVMWPLFGAWLEGRMSEAEFMEQADLLLRPFRVCRMLDELSIPITPSITCSDNYMNESGNAYLSLIQTVAAAISADLNLKYGDD